jgi:hypothetical protein
MSIRFRQRDVEVAGANNITDQGATVIVRQKLASRYSGMFLMKISVRPSVI